MAIGDVGLKAMRKMEEKGDETATKLKGRASLVINIFAALLAFNTFLNGSLNSTIMNNTIRANDLWNFYQAKSIKQSLAEMGLDHAIADGDKDLAQKYQDKIARDLDRAADAIGHGTGDDDEDRKLNNRMKGDERARAKLKKMKEEVEQVAEENHALAYVNATLAVMDEGKIDDLRDAQALRRANASAYDKNTKTDDKIGRAHV